MRPKFQKNLSGFFFLFLFLTGALSDLTFAIEFKSRNVNKKILLIATGLPASGKTHYLKKVVSVISNSVYLDKDLIADTFLGEYDNESDFYKKHVRLQSYDLMIKIAEDQFSSSRLVVLDSYFADKIFTPLFSKYIKPFLPQSSNTLSAVKSDDIQPYVIYFHCDDAQKNHARIVSRNEIKRDSDKLDPVKFAKYRKSRLLQHEELFSKLQSPEFRHIPLLKIQTDDESASADDRNMEQILKFLSD